MDENIISLLEELSLRTSVSEDEGASSSISSPANEQLSSNNSEEHGELKNAVNTLLKQHRNFDSRYDKTKMLAALLGNIDLVTDAVKKINQSIAIGKKMEEIYRSYYINPNIDLDLNEINQLIRAFSELYESERYVREVNVSRVYQAYCKKLIDIYNSRTLGDYSEDNDCMML